MHITFDGDPKYFAWFVNGMFIAILLDLGSLLS